MSLTCINKKSPEYQYLKSMVAPNVLDAFWSVYGMPSYDSILAMELQGKTQEEIISALYTETLTQADISNNLDIEDANDNSQASGVDSYVESLKIAVKRNGSLLRDLRDTAKEAYEAKREDDFKRLTQEAAVIEDRINSMKDKIDDLTNDEVVDKERVLFQFASQDMEDYRDKLIRRVSQDRKTAPNAIELTNEELDGISKVLRVLQRADEIFITDDLNDLANAGDQDAVNEIIAAKAMKSDAQNMLSMVDTIHKNELAAWHDKILDKKISLTDKDIGGLTAQLLDLSHVNDPIAQTLYREVKRISSTAAYKSKQKADKLDELYKPLVKKYGKKRLMDMLQEKDSSGNPTGNLASEIDASYYEDMTRARETGKDAYKQWMRDNIAHISATALSAGQETESDTRARKNLGNAVFEERKAEAKRKLEEYEHAREAMWASIETKYEGDPDRIMEEKKKWEHLNSPYVYEQFISGDKAMFKPTTDNKGELLQGVDPEMINLYGNPNGRFVEKFPANSNHYSQQYKDIQGNTELKAYYNEIRDSLKSIHKSMPYNKRRGISSNTIPFVERTIAEEFREEGMRSAGATMWESFKQSFRQREDSRMFYGYQDPYDGYTEDYLEGPVYDNKRLREEEYQILKSKFDGVPNADQVVELRKQAAANVANRSTDNFNAIITSYTYAAESYKMKSQIEDMVKISQNIMAKRQERVNLSTGQEKKTFQGNIFTKGQKGSFSNLNELINFHVNTQFYDKKNEDNFLKAKEKSYTAKEEKQLAELNDLLQKTDDPKEKEAIENRIHRLGGFVSGANTIDNAMLYVQNKGMAFNLPAGVANYMQGNIAAWTHAAGGRDFDSNEFRKAWWITNRSLGKGITKDGKKMMLLMEHFDILKDASEELYSDDAISQLGKEIAGDRKWMKRFSSFYINRKVEYMNQAPVMAAMLMNRGLWDKFDVKGDKLTFNGEEVVDNDASKFHVTSDDYHKQRLQIDHIIKKLNGNYDPYSRIQIKKSALGRAAMQFRSWIPELINERFGGEKYDAVMDRTERGRYRDLITKKGFIGLLKNTIPFLNAQVLGDDGQVDDLATHNARKNAKELQIYLVMAATAYALGALAAEDDDEAWYLNMLANQALRARKDIEFFANPFEAEKISKNILPLVSVMSDGWGIVSAVGHASIGDDEIKHGSFTGDSRLFRELMQGSPFLLPQVYRLYSMSSQIYNK